MAICTRGSRRTAKANECAGRCDHPSVIRRDRTAAWASVPQYTLKGTTSPVADSRTPFRTQRGFWTFGILMWLLAMLCNLGVAIYERESAGAMVFTFTLLSVGIAFWLWVFRRLTR